jgi:hypothetical protein
MLPQKITFGEMPASGTRGLLVYWLWKHESGTYVKFTRPAEPFA